MDSFIKGLYIAPEKVENVCCRSTFIAQMFLYGDSLRSSCVAIVVPDEEVLTQWAQEHGKGDKSFEELCSDEVTWIMQSSKWAFELLVLCRKSEKWFWMI